MAGAQFGRPLVAQQHGIESAVFKEVFKEVAKN
jgi:hypothetical protein